MKDDKKWNIYHSAVTLENELKISEEYKLLEIIIKVNRAIFSVRYNFNQYNNHLKKFEGKQLIFVSGIKRWHQQKITSVLIGNYFSSCYSLLDIMENLGFNNNLKDDLFIKLTREMRNFMLHRQVLPITNNEKHWKEEDGQIHYKSLVTTSCENIKQYLENEKRKMKSLIEYFENKSYEKIPLSEIIFELKNVLESNFASRKKQFVNENKKSLIILEEKYKDISQMIIEADMSHYKAVGIKYRYLRLLLFVYSENKNKSV